MLEILVTWLLITCKLQLLFIQVFTSEKLRLYKQKLMKTK